MAKVKFPSMFLKDRRCRLGLESVEVANKIGVPPGTYRQIECRGELPEDHFPRLAEALQVSVNELKAEKIATMIEATLGIRKEDTHAFIGKALRGNGH